MKFKKISLFIFISALTFAAHAETIAIEGLPVHLGDTVQEFQSAMDTGIEPEAMPTANQFAPQKTMIRLKTKGIWVFFNKQQKIETIRLDAPFQGNIGGVTIGSSHDAMIKKLGNPASIMNGNLQRQDRSFPALYFIDDKTEARFDFDRDDEVARIFIFHPTNSR
jgi:hypothetical protein